MRVSLLGPLSVQNDSATIEVSGTRLRLLLVLLAVDAPRAISAATLIDVLWPDEPPGDETNALQSLVSRLRKTLGDASLVQQSAAAGYRLTVDTADVDIHRFEQLAAAGREALRAGDLHQADALLAQASELWRGEPVELAEARYAGATFARLGELRLDSQADWIETGIALGRSDRVIAELEGLCASHPLRERFTTLLIRALHAAGRHSEALVSYEKARALLADKLGVDPSPDLQAAYLDVLRSDPSTTDAPVGNNLRATLTSFVGREEELVHVGNLLAANRLVTLVGPGGAGKTRLAGAAATALDHDDIGGVWMSELAPVTDPADVPQAVLGSLGLRDAILLERPSAMTPRDATSRLIAALSARSAVIVLDNCEHLINAAAHLADQLLAACPTLRILATSREPLGIFGEALVVVPPLDQPQPDAEAKAALEFPAVKLFADRAADVQPGFEVDEATVGPVIQIVRRLDGLPLAIELAAARLRSLPVAEVERRLSDRFRLLTGGSRTAMPRHRTLRAVVEWSWDLLSEPERLLTERLAVFSGGITPTAAAAVCCDAGLAVDDIDDLLTSLVDKSLLQSVTVPDATPRFRMLETIREFGLERMAERGEVGRIRLAHASYFAALVTEADPHLRRPEQLEWMALLDLERDNILAALKYLGDDGHAEASIDLVNLLGWYWMTVGNHGEIVTWVTFALEVPGEVDPAKRVMAEAFLAINSVAWNVKVSEDEVEAGMTHLAELGRQMAELAPTGPKMLTLLAPVIAMFTDNRDQLDLLTERALHDEDPWVAAAIRTFRASMAENVGDLTMMRDDAERALAAFREIGERWGMANSLQVLGQLELIEGNLVKAAAAYREGIEMATAIGGREDIALMRLRLADILARLDDTEGAFEQAELAREAAAQSGSPLEVLFARIFEVELSRSVGDLATARDLRDKAIDQLRRLPDAHPIQGHGLAVLLASAAKIDLEDGAVGGVRTQLDEAYEHAIKTKDMPIVAMVGVATAMLAVRLERLADAAEILGAAAQLRGADDSTNADVVAMDRALGGLGDGAYAENYRTGKALARDQAILRVKPDSLS